MIVYEVGPRDGLQGLKPLPTEKKVELIDGLSDAGLKYIEVVSFVDPKYIPQMADATEVARGIRRKKGVVYSALVPNMKFYAQAQETDMPEIAVFLSANEEHNIKNLGRDIATTKERLKPVFEAARKDERTVRGYVSTAWGYKGDDTPVADVIGISRWLLDEGAYQVSLGDTTGMGTRRTIQDRLLDIREEFGDLNRFALHLHTKREDMEHKVGASYISGMRIFDSSLYGLGGCPTDELLGNVDTEELVKHFEAEGVATGVDLDQLGRASTSLRNTLREI